MCVGLLLWLCVTAFGESAQPGKNYVDVRGRSQEIYFYPGSDSTGARRGAVLFAPGDGGWRGFALSIARSLSSWGHDVYGFDTKHYLESFTDATTLAPAEVMRDIRQLSDWTRAPRVILIGWSEGAGLMVLAAAAPPKDRYEGVITLGLADLNVLGWRLADNLTYLTKKRPNEPTFSSRAYADKITPLPLVMIQSTADEYVRREEAELLFASAAQPKRFISIKAQNHRFDGNQDEFFRQLRGALQWISENRK